jgi:lipopolysaccharide assembly protein A
MRKILILSFVLTILAVIFALQNSVPVGIIFYFWTVQIPLALVIVFSMTIGAVLGILFSLPGRKKKKVIEANTETDDINHTDEQDTMSVGI